MRVGFSSLLAGATLASLLAAAGVAWAQLEPVIPEDERGQLDSERSGILDAANIRTVYWNYGMVGDYPPEPGNVDLSVFHSAEVPKGSGMNYTDGITPFVLAKIVQRSGAEAYIMETGFRERQATSPRYNRTMRFEPRPGWFQADPNLNPALSPAVSSDPRTWPASWPDKLLDPDDPGWSNSWNGYFGKARVADQETFMVLDDNFYDGWDYYPDSRDSTRRGLGLRIELRGFQWANPQARNVIFWHYDITNESTTDYNDNIIFGLYMDSGVGGPALSCDGIFESDDDNAFYTQTFDGQKINLVYTWDEGGHGRDLNSACGTTGYLGYAYLETPGNSTDGVDNDEDGVTDELRNGGPGQLIEGQQAIQSYVQANYDLQRFETAYGPLDELPAFRLGSWWTGDEDMDWVAEVHDTGGDGLLDTQDTGEGDGMPSEGEPNFDRTDLNESDQIGLTGFKINRIRPGQGNPNQTVDDILFFTNSDNWPQRLYDQFTHPVEEERFDPQLTSNYNIGFLFASGPFKLRAGQTERFSLALAYGADLTELGRTVKTVQQIYDSNYRFAVPPPAPTVTAEAGDGFVRLSWDNIAEQAIDPVTGDQDFEGYRIYRSTDVNFLDAQEIRNATGTDVISRKPITQFDLIDGRRGFSEQTEDGVSFWLGTDSGIQHTWTDHSVTNGQQYFYAVSAYDFGSESEDPDKRFFPSENAYTGSLTLRAGLVLPSNVIVVRPNPRVAGYEGGTISLPTQTAGRGLGTVDVEVVNSELVPGGHQFEIGFETEDPLAIRATSYTLKDLTEGTLLFRWGRDFDGKGVGPVGSGLLPLVTQTEDALGIDPDSTGFTDGYLTDAELAVSYLLDLSNDRRRPGYPDDITVTFYDNFVGAGIPQFPFTAAPAKFDAVAHTAAGELPLNFRFRDLDGDGTLSQANEVIDLVSYLEEAPTTPRLMWRLRLAAGSVTTTPPAAGDQFEIFLRRPLGVDDKFVFSTMSQTIDRAQERAEFEPYVVPNPYVGSASFEPQRFADTGRGERRIEFRGVPSNCTIRIYTVRGDLVQTLRHDRSNDGFVTWDLRTRDNLDVAPGLYIYHVDGGQAGKYIGKFGVVK
jgi:hypothetical protein